MNFNLTEKQKTTLISALIAMFIVVAGLLGYEVKATPIPATPPPVELGAQALINSGIKCGASADPCVISNFGRDLNVYSDEGATSKFSVDGATGNTIVVGTLDVTGALGITGALTQSGGQSNSNWLKVTAPTSIASATPAVVIDSTGGVSNLLEIRKNATPVFSVNTSGNTTLTGSLNVTGAVNGYKCVYGTQNVIGSATAIPATLTAAGIATPSFVITSLGTDATGDGLHLTHTKASGVVTLKVWDSALTPVAATTVVAVDYQVCGN